VRDRVAEADAPVQDGRRSRAAEDLDDLSAFPSEQLRDVLAGLLADEPVVRPDEQRVVEPDHRPVEEDDGNAVIGLGDDRRERLRLVRRDDEEVDAGVQEGVHVLDLAAVRIRRIREDDPQVAVARRLGVDLVPHADAPRLGEVGHGDTDDVVEGLGIMQGRAAGRKEQEERGQEERETRQANRRNLHVPPFRNSTGERPNTRLNARLK
jgi:hypothetical protein